MYIYIYIYPRRRPLHTLLSVPRKIGSQGKCFFFFFLSIFDDARRAVHLHRTSRVYSRVTCVYVYNIYTQGGECTLNPASTFWSQIEKPISGGLPLAPFYPRAAAVRGGAAAAALSFAGGKKSGKGRETLLFKCDTGSPYTDPRGRLYQESLYIQNRIRSSWEIRFAFAIYV